MIVLGEKDHTFVNEHEKIQSCNYLACLMLTLITQIPEPSITKLLLTPYKLIGRSEVGGGAFEFRCFGEEFLSVSSSFPCAAPLLWCSPRCLPEVFTRLFLEYIIHCAYLQILGYVFSGLKAGGEVFLF